MKHLALCCVVVFFLVSALPAGTDPRQDYEDKYGADAKKVANADALSFAATLLNDAQATKDAPDKVGCLVEKAAEFYARGLPGVDKDTVAAALLRLQLAQGDCLYRADRLSEAVAFYQQAAATAAAMKSDKAADAQLRAKLAQELAAAQKKARDLEARLKSTPADAASAKTLVKLCIVQLDDPALAMSFLDAAGDDKSARLVKAAAGNTDEIPAQTAFDLAKWYQGLAAEAGVTAGAKANARAKSYFERFLTAYDKHDLSRVAAAKNLEEINKELDKLPVMAKPQWFTARFPTTEPAANCAQPIMLVADLVRIAEKMGTWRHIVNDGEHPPVNFYWEFKKDGVARQVVVYSSARVDEPPTGLWISPLKWKIDNGKLVVYQQSFNAKVNKWATLDLSVAGDTFVFPAKSPYRKVDDGTLEAQTDGLFELFQKRTKIPGTWRQTDGNSGIGHYWLFGDNGDLLEFQPEGGQREVNRGTWELKDQTLHTSMTHTGSYRAGADRITFSILDPKHDIPVVFGLQKFDVTPSLDKLSLDK